MPREPGEPQSIVVTVPLRWADQDAHGYIDAPAYARILEDARVRAFWSEPDGALAPLAPGERAWSLVSSFNISYELPLRYSSKRVQVAMTISDMGGASFVIRYLVTTDEGSLLHATAASTIVMVDADSGSPRRLGAEARAHLTQYLQSPGKPPVRL